MPSTFLSRVFFSEKGAIPFENRDDLTRALQVLFFERYELGLEELADAPMDLPPETTSCSDQTFEDSMPILRMIEEGFNYRVSLIE